MPKFDALPLQDRIFSLLAISASALLLIAVLFAILTVVIRVRHSREARLRAAQDAKWNPVILEVLDGSKEPAALLDLVQPGEELSFLDYLLLYARRIRGEERRILEALAGPHSRLLLERARRGRVERRAWAVQTLGLLGMPEHTDTLLEALDDPSPLVSLIAAQSLAERGPPQSLQFILERLDRYSEWHVAFLSGLLADAGSAAVPLLRSTLADDHRPDWVRAIVAQSLRNLLDLESADIAANILRQESDPDLLVACLRLIVDTGEGRHRESLIPLLDSPHFPVRSHALKALRVVGDASDIPLFLKAVEDASPWVALEGARGLREMGALGPLHDLARTEGPRSSLARQVISE